MNVSEFFPVWDELSKADKDLINSSGRQLFAEKDQIVHSTEVECTGLILILEGQLRVYIESPEGKEITLYRLLDRDICLLSASCMIKSLQFNITVEAEKDTTYILIPAEVYNEIQKRSAPLSNFTNELMASRFSEVMWLMDQIMWKSFDSRLAAFLLEESSLDDSDVIMITHEKIASHLGTAREVVTRMLKYFQNEGLISLKRGSLEILDEKRLSELV